MTGLPALSRELVVLEIALRVLADMRPAAAWVAVLIAAVTVLFALYVGVAMMATLRAADPVQAKTRYRVFRDLLTVFHRRRSR
jgi:flagellar biosynthesis protein FliQ